MANRPTTIDAYLRSGRPQVIAHRGFSGKAPENTLAAIDMALDLGVDMVEVDVTLTSDGELVVLHDASLDRTTSGSGRVMNHSLEQIRSLDAGSWFDVQFSGELVPTLDEVLTRVCGRALLNVEIKGEAVTEGIAGGIAEKVAERIGEAEMIDQVIVSSFEPRALHQLRHLDPRIYRAVLYNRELHRHMRPSEIMEATAAHAFHIHVWRWTPRRWPDARRHGLPVAVYTVNHRLAMTRVLKTGALALFTDRPDRMLRLLNRRAGTFRPLSRRR